MTATPGWLYLTQLRDNVIQQATDAAIEEDDPARAEQKRLEAKAMRRGLLKIWSTVEQTRAFNPEGGNNFSLMAEEK